MSDSEADTSRTVVQTYVPAYQREEWDEHADQLGMSRSEFVRTMVQAGRRGFGASPEPREGSADNTEASDTHADSLDEQVLAALADGDALSWEELLAAVTDDIESRLEETLQSLQTAGKLRYSGPQGGYVLEEDE
jgi:hypothetical protein